MIEIMVDYAKLLMAIGIRYKWGGTCALEGLDCSQFIQEVLSSIGKDPQGDQTAQSLHDIMRVYCTQDIVKKGTILFFGVGKLNITHVALCIDDGGKYMIEAGGGGSKTLTLQDAIDKNAFVRIRPIRKDLIAFLNLV